MQFTSQQLEIIENFGQGQAVIAGAGCGKTTTLVAKCLALLKTVHPLKTKSGPRFCAVSFTEKSVRDLKEALAKGLKENGFHDQRHHHWVKTIHGLCATVIQEFPTAAGLQGGERILLEDESSRLWARSVNALWSSNDNPEISAAVVSLLGMYSKNSLELLLYKLKNLLSFGVEEWIQKSITGVMARPEVKSLWICFESVHRRYVHSKARLGALDFNDLEVFALKALEHDWVCRHFHQLFDLVLVDEFQDTNPIQGKILERFARPGFTNLCIVGDPKQSIYRFRDADVTVFFDLTERLARKHLLTENYRSRPGIIHFVNEVCEKVFEASGMAYEPLSAGRPVGESEGAPVWRLTVKPESEQGSPLVAYLQSQVAAGVDLSEYAILARSLKGKTQKILQQLNQAGIPYVLGSGGRFFSDPRVQELVAFLKGFCSPAHKFSQWTALRSPWVAVPEKTLLGWRDHFYEHFFKSEHPLARALASFYQNPAIRPGQILEVLFATLENQSAEELSVPLLSLWHKAEALSAQGLRFEEVIQNFTDAIESDKLEKEIPPPAQKGAVRVLTIHGSKGLQFPRVILTDFDGPNRGGRGFKDLIWDRKKGVHLFHRDEDGEKNKKDPQNMEWEDLEKRNAVAESKRLFYVAITRPQEELILYWPSEAKESKEPLQSDNWRAWVELYGLPPEKDFSSSPIPRPEKTTQNKIKKAEPLHLDLIRYRPRHSPSEWRILNQCAQRYYWKWVDPQQSEANQPPVAFAEEDAISVKAQVKKEKRAEAAAEKGERVHEYLETQNWSDLAKVFAAEKNSSAGEVFVKKIKSVLDDRPQGGPISVYPEIGFEVPLHELVEPTDEALVGMMDRLEVGPEQKWLRVIDYKWTENTKSPE